MKCPFCGSFLSRVVDKRGVKGSGDIRRRRACLKCQGRFTTYERIGNLRFEVVKRDGRREPFNKEKLMLGIAKALEKRPALEKLDFITEKIEHKLRAKGKEVSSKVVGQTVLTELKHLDKVAYLRFASVYRKFEDPTDFAKELQNLN